MTPMGRSGAEDMKKRWEMSSDRALPNPPIFKDARNQKKYVEMQTKHPFVKYSSREKPHGVVLESIWRNVNCEGQGGFPRNRRYRTPMAVA
jgi:hypothetical protein